MGAQFWFQFHYTLASEALTSQETSLLISKPLSLGSCEQIWHVYTFAEAYFNIECNYIATR